MRYVALLTIALWAVPLPIMAQAEAALDATRVRQHVVLSFGKRIEFAADNSGNVEHFKGLDAGQLFAVRSSMKVLLAYLNPLEYEWSLSTRSTPDPLLEGITRFVSLAASFPGLDVAKAVTTAGGGGPLAELASLLAAKTSPKTSTGQLALADPSLIEWNLWTNAYPDCLVQTVRAAAQLDAASLDQLLYGMERTEGAVLSAADFAGTLSDAINTLKSAGDLHALSAAATSVAVAGKRLQEANRTAAKKAEGLKATGRSLAAQPKGAGVVCALIPDYSERIFNGVATRAAEVITQREALVAALQAIETQIRDMIPQKKSEIDGFPIGEVKVTRGQRTIATVTVTKREVVVGTSGIQINTGASQTFSFEVMEHQSVLTELKPGVAYSPVIFPRYKTNAVAGHHVIAEAEEYRPKTIPMEMLNLMPNTGWRGFTRLIGQIGLGVTTEAAVVLAGAGIRFSAPTNFVLTAGAVFPFTQKLKDGVKVGDTVAGEADLTSKVERVLNRRASFYIGIQR